MADLLDYYLGPTGLPDRLRFLNELLNPYAEPMRHAEYAMDENLSPEQRQEHAAYAASQAGIASLPGAMYARRAAKTLRSMMQPDPEGVTAGRAIRRRDDTYRGEGSASVPDSFATSEYPYATRSTGMDQLEDMISSGVVRPKPGGYGANKKSTLYFGETNSSDPMASIFGRPTPDKPVLLMGDPKELAGYEGGIPIDVLEHIFVRQENGEVLDLLEEILARNRAYQ
jgi:hypothetical protein